MGTSHMIHSHLWQNKFYCNIHKDIQGSRRQFQFVYVMRNMETCKVSEEMRKVVKYFIKST
jgi:hypothetical protein